MLKLAQKKGFTLIELLVVISIILILVSFVVPQIGGARAKARKVKCLNNLRVIGAALVVQASDADSPSYVGDLQALYPGFIGNADAFDCPATAAKPTADYNAGTVTSGDYQYLGGQSDESTVPIAICTGEHGGGKCVLFATGDVRFVESGDSSVDLSAVEAAPTIG